jgi:hypothetical protein
MNFSTPDAAMASMLHAIDAVDWPVITQAFATRVVVDYSSLTGQPQATLDREVLIGGWQALLPGFDATQHMLGPIIISREDAIARAEAHVRGYHHIKGAPGGETWMVAGHYTAGLVDQGGQWSIDRLTLTVFYQAGNLSLPDLARARVATSPRVRG